MPAELLEAPVEAIVTDLLQDRRLVEATQRALSDLIEAVKGEDHEREVKRLKKALTGEETKLQRLVDDRAGAESEEERHACQAAIDRVNRRVAGLRNQLEAHQEALQRASHLLEAPDRAQDRAATLVTLYGEASRHEKRAVYMELIHRVAIGKNLCDVALEIRPF